ncbi:hypothetical protein [Cerasicoccus fimbriatus]|uniref:hypothetical protein n=1 Tax=Cerasicoccus fimbriatus TaxID=3014554 RepID=UPI0022B3555F|nr:hypothetical protein [Cerasicoccus sp. TK19100]
MNSKLSLFAALWIGSLAAAYFVGQSTSEEAEPSAATSASQKSANAKMVDKDGALIAIDEEAAAGLIAEIEKEAQEQSLAGFTALRSGDFSRTSWMQANVDAMGMSASQLQDALNEVLAMPAGRERNMLVYSMLERWGMLDPTNALAYADSLTSMEMRSRGIGQVLEGWAANDPVSAINWLNQNGSELSARMYGDYLNDIVQGYAQSSPQSAFQFVQGLPEETVGDRRIKSDALDEVIEIMVEQNQINQALEMTLALEPGNARNQALEDLVDEWADVDPLAAKAFVDSMIDDPAYGDMQRELLSAWADDDPAAAAEWLSSLDPETTDQARLATSLVANWTRYDMEAAANWLNSLPQTPELDRAVGIFSMRAAQDDPATALTWANSISNEQSRDRLESMILPMLREQDNEAFEAYLADSDYSDDKKQQFREQPVREGGYRGWGRWGR